MKKEIYFAGGCFWGTEKYFSLILGVEETQVGYANGNCKNPSYEMVCTGNTAFAETCKVVYNNEEVSLEQLLQRFFEVIDPTTLNRQGGDTGSQYRTGVYYTNETDAPIIEKALADLQREYSDKVVVEAMVLQSYYPAEAYHQKYLDKNPGGYCHIPAAKFAAAKD